MFGFEVERTEGAARVGRLTTPHGVVETPAFMPVGTAGAVKAVTFRDVREAGAQIVLANTYHLMLRPGDELVAAMGGLHRFSGWDGPMLTDSGGYQVFSLAALRELSEQGVAFRSHLDGTACLHRFSGWDGSMLTDSGGYQVFSLSALRELSEQGVAFRSHLDGTACLLTPERSIQVQMNLGADVIMAFDECPPFPAPREAVVEATDRTTRWAERSLAAHTRRDQWLFGIVQGGVFPDLRQKSARELIALDFPGYAVGGLSVGEPKEDMWRVLDALRDVLPAAKPRYLMGVGTPEDLLEGVARGIDLFDCVLPTRNARNGQLFTSEGRLSIRNARYRTDERPPDARCRCFTCRTATRAYLRHLHQAGEMTAATLMTIHNLAHYLDTLDKMRQSLRLGRFEAYRQETLRALAAPAGGS